MDGESASGARFTEYGATDGCYLLVNGLCAPGPVFVAGQLSRDCQAALFDNGLCADAAFPSVGVTGVDLQFEYPT